MIDVLVHHGFHAAKDRSVFIQNEAGSTVKHHLQRKDARATENFSRVATLPVPVRLCSASVSPCLARVLLLNPTGPTPSGTTCLRSPQGRAQRHHGGALVRVQADLLHRDMEIEMRRRLRVRVR